MYVVGQVRQVRSSHRLINNGKDGTRLVFAHTGVDPPR